MIAYIAFRIVTLSPTDGPRATPIDPLSYQPQRAPSAAGRDDAMNLDALAALPGDEPLAAEPAGLPPYAGGTRLMGLRRTTGRQIDDMAYWSMPDAGVDDLAAFYAQAAEALGFSPSAEADRRSDATNLAFRRNNDLLLIRLQGRDRSVRAFVWFSYTVAGPRPDSEP